MITNTLGWIGATVVGLLVHLSNIFYLAKDILYWLFVGPKRGKPLRLGFVVREMDEMGARSFPLILVMSCSLGAVLIVLFGLQLRTFGVSDYASSIVTVFLIRELNPLLTGIVLAGRVGALVTARLGTMIVEDEMLALEVMAINPVEYLILPRFAAAVIILPCLTLVADLISVFVSVLIATVGLDLSLQMYLDGALSAFTVTDIFFSLLKSVIFGILIILIACYAGISVSGGAESVGHATMVSVVYCTITVIIADGILSLIFYLL